MPGRTVLDNLRTATDDATEAELRAALGHFGLTANVAGRDARVLSGGEKTRLALTRFMVSRANLLLLDEPTNNLDPQSVSRCWLRVLLLPESNVVFFEERVLGMIPKR